MAIAYVLTNPVKKGGASISLLYAHQNCRCFYCNRYMEYQFYTDKVKRGFTQDHLFPKSKGYNKFGNTVLACRRCNEKKGDRIPTVTEIAKAWELYNNCNRPFIARLELC